MQQLAATKGVVRAAAKAAAAQGTEVDAILLQH
jgi:hypothetical protein